MHSPTELTGLALLLVAVLLIVAIAVSRWRLSRSGGVDLCWRGPLDQASPTWTFGQGRYEDRGLVLFRSFSPLPLPARILHRDAMVLGTRRPAGGAEPDLLPVGSVIVACTVAGRPFELALSEAALTGLRSWLESLPPAHRGPRSRLREV